MINLIKWGDLTKPKQEEILMGWVRKIRCKPEICGLDVLSVDFGVKDSDNKLRKQLCLKFVVKNKLKPSPRGMQCIHLCIAAATDLNGQTVEVMIPIDVEDMFTGEEQSDD